MYTPSRDDLPPPQNYSPSRDDLPPPAQQNSLLGNDLNSPGMHFIQGAGAGWGNTYGNIANLIPGVNVPQIQRPQGAASDLGAALGTVGGFLGGGEVVDALRGATEAAPYVGVLAKYLGQPGFGGALGMAGRGAAVGAAANPTGNRGMGALLGTATELTAGAVPSAISAVSAAPQAARDLMAGISGKTTQNMADKTYTDMAQSIEKPTMQTIKNPLTGQQQTYQTAAAKPSTTLAPDELNKQNAQIVSDNYNQQKNLMTGRYNQFNNTVQQNGYATSGKPTVTSPLDVLSTKVIGTPGSAYDPAKVIQDPNVSNAINPQKFIPYGDEISNKLNAIVKNSPSDSGLQNTQSALNAHIQNYLDSPTFNNAHLLQSKLGEAGADFNGFTADSSDKATGQALNSVRGDIKNNILNNFRSNGDSQLANQYQNLNNDYKNNVAPYFESKLWGAINGKTIPNVTGALAKDDLAGKADIVRQHIAQNPEQSQSILAQAMNKYTNRNPDGSYSVSKPAKGEQPKSGVNEFLNGYDNLPSSLKQFAPASGLDKQMETLRQQNNKYPWIKPIKKYPKTSLGLGLGALGLMGVPVHELL